MRPLTTKSGMISAGLFTFLLLILATVAITGRPTPRSTPGVAAGAKRPGMYIRYAPTAARRVLNVHRASPSIENLSSMPRIFIARIEGTGRGVQLRRGVLSNYTPIRLRVENMLVDEIETPTRMQYVLYGGTSSDGTVEVVQGMGPQVEVGKRYVLYTEPLITDDNGYDRAYMTVNYAAPVDDHGQVTDLTAGGKEIKVPLAQAIARIKRGAAEARWSPERPK